MNADKRVLDLRSENHPRSSAFIFGSSSLNQLDVVAKRVAKMETFEAGDLRLVLDRQAGLFDLLAPGGSVVDLVRLMGPRGAAVDVFLHADVHLELPGVEPETFASKHRRTRDFLHAEEAEVKLPSFL